MNGKKDNYFDEPTYIVLNVPSPVADKIRETRRYFDPARSLLSVEISVAGSNGLGTITPGQDHEMVFAAIDHVAAMCQPFKAEFGRVERFKDTGIYYYMLEDPEPFIKIHHMLHESAVRFEPVNYEYEPHCTLKLGKHLEYSEEEILKKIQPPPEEFIINTLSVYSLVGEDAEPKLLHRINLGTPAVL
jgi:2'-5' RNA ligase